MSNKEKEVATENAQTVVKKNRRGVSNKTKAVAQLKFHEKDAAQNGLFIGHLESVEVAWSTNSEGKAFTGMAVPRLVFHFASNHVNESEKRHVYQSVNPIESNVNTIPGGSEEWRVNNALQWIKHILDVFYLKGRELTEEEENALALPFEDFNEAGEYVSVEPETVIAGYAAIFNNASAMLNGSWNLEEGAIAKPCFKTADGKIIPCWLKLLRHKKYKNQWNNIVSSGDLAFDPFIGNGVVELLVKDKMPTVLRIDMVKESITPKEVNKAPSIGMPGMANPMFGGVMPTEAPMNMGVNSANSAAFADAGDQMPF